MACTLPIHPLAATAQPLKVSCADCHLRGLCLPAGLSGAALDGLAAVVSRQVQVLRGGVLFQAGDALTSLYAVRTGFFKTRVAAEDGREQVAGFQMPGDLLGLAALDAERHTVEAVALENSQVCVIPYAGGTANGKELQQQLLRMMSRLIVRDHGVMLLLGSMRAGERLAAFLITLTRRLQALGYSASALVLRMTREDIGSYLGMKVETVSRTFSGFQAQGLLEVRQREIRILDLARLQEISAA